MTNLSEKQGGGNIYSPAMMQYDGSTSYYSGTFTSSGNEVRTILRFKAAPFTGGGTRRLVCIRGPANRFRTLVNIYSSDHATAARRNKLAVVVQNSSGTNICLLFSLSNVANSLLHTLDFSFNGTTGVASFIINGQAADDTGNGERVAPTTGTLDSGASSDIHIGALFGPSEFFLGHMGYVAHIQAHGTNWQTYQDQYGNPKNVSFASWLFANQHGEMTNNQGTGGALTKNGTINVGNGGAGPFPQIGLPTLGTAVAADIHDGETAWVNGNEVVGILKPMGQEGTKLYWDMGVGAAGSYTPDPADAQYADPAITLISSNNWSKDGNGYLFGTSSGYLLLTGPTKTGVCREYRMFTAETHASPSQFHQMAIIFNRQDASNFWYARYMRNTTGTWNCEIVQVTATVETSRGSASFTATIDPPGYFELILQDWGDTIHFTVIAVDGSPPSGSAEVESKSISYFASSRALKSQTTFGIINQFTEFGGVRNLHVRDINAPA